MGILDFLKKKSPKVAENGALALDELPPIPAEQEAPTPTGDMPPLGDLPENIPSADTAPTSDMPELPNAAQSEPELGAEPVDALATPEDGLTTPNAEVNNEVFEKLNADLAAEQAPEPVTESVTENPTYADEVPSKEEIEEVLLADKKEELPGFEEEKTTSLSESDSWSAQEEPVPVKTESLLLKSIFVEREHYANLLFSLRVVKDDLEKSAPQQRKLSTIDMKLGKQYSKLSTVYENFNENIMMIEHIISNEKF